MHNENTLGLVLTAGGARGAYQSGVLERISKIKQCHLRSPFHIITGASAGAINGTALAAGSDQFLETARYLSSMWKQLKTENVFKTDLFSFAESAGRLLKDLSIGRMIGNSTTALLDSTPLKAFLGKHLFLNRIENQIRQNHLYALAIIATDYDSGHSFIFVQGQSGHPVWQKSRRIVVSGNIALEHILASTAIPLIFPPTLVKTPFGEQYCGDGAIRLKSPLSPAIRLGAKKIFSIGVSQQATWGLQEGLRKPSLAQIIGLLLNSIFIDQIETDLEHLERINELIENVPLQSVQHMTEPLQPLRTLNLTPSEDVRWIAQQHTAQMPKILRHLVESLGGDHTESADLMSYLIFDEAYTKDLVSLGYKDADQRINEIEDFLFH